MDSPIAMVPTGGEARPNAEELGSRIESILLPEERQVLSCEASFSPKETDIEETFPICA